MATLEDVSRWFIDGQISHIAVKGTGGGWVLVLCDRWFLRGLHCDGWQDLPTKPGPLICPKCETALKSARIMPRDQHANEAQKPKS